MQRFKFCRSHLRTFARNTVNTTVRGNSTMYGCITLEGAEISYTVYFLNSNISSVAGSSLQKSWRSSSTQPRNREVQGLPVGYRNPQRRKNPISMFPQAMKQEMPSRPTI